MYKMSERMILLFSCSLQISKDSGIILNELGGVEFKKTIKVIIHYMLIRQTHKKARSEMLNNVNCSFEDNISQ